MIILDRVTLMRIIHNRSSIINALLGAVAGLCLLCGCSGPADKYAYSRLAGPYRRIQLKTSSTLDVLSLLDSPTVRVDPNAVAVQLLTQSDTAAALSGKSTDGQKIWVNWVAFDEYRMTARRKYFFCSDERAVAPDDLKGPTTPAPGTLIFDAQFVIDPEIATTPYATDEAKKIAIVRWLAERCKGDVRNLAGRAAAVTQTDDIVSTAGLMMNQVFQGVLVELDQSSALAKTIGTEQGIEFPHISLDKGRIRLLVAEGIGTVAIRVNLPMPPLPAP